MTMFVFLSFSLSSSFFFDNVTVSHSLPLSHSLYLNIFMWDYSSNKLFPSVEHWMTNEDVAIVCRVQIFCENIWNSHTHTHTKGYEVNFIELRRQHPACVSLDEGRETQRNIFQNLAINLGKFVGNFILCECFANVECCKQFQDYCCAFHDTKVCVENVATDKCGAEAAKVIAEFMKKFTTNVLPEDCVQYDSFIACTDTTLLIAGGKFFYWPKKCWQFRLC